MARSVHRNRRAVLPRLAAGAAAGEVLDLLVEHGCLVLEGALDGPALGALDAGLTPWFGRARCGRGPFFGRRTRRFSGVFAKAPETAALAIDPLVLEVMERLLKGPDPQRPLCDAIELHLTQAIAIGPGEPAQVLHRDDAVWPFRRDFEAMANAMWALDDFTAENGATVLVPGSHRWPRERDAQPGEAVAATAPAGSVVLWLGGLLHGGGANRSKRPRRGLVMSYRLGWLAGAEKLLLSTPPEVAARLPERLQRLIGYQLHRPNLGWVEGRDPLLWLRGETGALAAADDNLTPGLELYLRRALADVGPRPMSSGRPKAEAATPPRPAREIIREMILASGGVTEGEARVLLKVLRRLEEIETEYGPIRAEVAAQLVESLWLEASDAAEPPPGPSRGDPVH